MKPYHTEIASVHVSHTRLRDSIQIRYELPHARLMPSLPVPRDAPCPIYIMPFDKLGLCDKSPVKMAIQAIDFLKSRMYEFFVRTGYIGVSSDIAASILSRGD